MGTFYIFFFLHFGCWFDEMNVQRMSHLFQEMMPEPECNQFVGFFCFCSKQGKHRTYSNIFELYSFYLSHLEWKLDVTRLQYVYIEMSMLYKTYLWEVSLRHVVGGSIQMISNAFLRNDFLLLLDFNVDIHMARTFMAWSSNIKYNFLDLGLCPWF